MSYNVVDIQIIHKTTDDPIGFKCSKYLHFQPLNKYHLSHPPLPFSIMPRYLNLLVNFIVNQYFLHEHCFFLLTDQEYNSHIESSIPVVVLRDRNATFCYESLFTNHHGCQAIILHVQEPHIVFHELENQIRLHLDRFNQRKYLILPTQEGFESTVKAFETLFTYVADVLLIVLQKVSKKQIGILDEVEELYSLYTHRYIGKENINQPVLIQKWSSNNSEFSSMENLYPDKLNNQMGRPLKVATFTYLPYSIPSR